MILEKTFKTALNSIWYNFTSAAALVDRLEGMGLSVVPGSTTGDFGSLFGIQERNERCILELLGIDTRADGQKEGELLYEELDQFLCDVRTQYPENEGFPEEHYEGLLDIIRNAGIEIPWERTK